MTDLDQVILEAWERVWPWLRENPRELRKRLERRRNLTLQRPLRHRCLAVRASDRRITAAHWILTPEHAMDLDHPEHPYEPIEHEVTIQAYALRKFCRPVRTDSLGEEVVGVARQLGVSPACLRNARLAGQFREKFVKGLGGKRGRAVPLIHRWRALDPGWGRFYAGPDSICGMLWEFLPDRVPDDFEQTVLRRPIFQSRGSRRGETRFCGWRWICPGCKRAVKTIYYPLPVTNLCEIIGFDPAKRKSGRELGIEDHELYLPAKPPPTFACCRCHEVQGHSSVAGNSWNLLIGHLTAGLLYGCEVKRPEWYRPERKRARTRQLHRQALRRQQVERLLLEGRSSEQIALELGVSVEAVHQYTHRLCKEEDVPDRHALVAKLGGSCSPPLNVGERAAKTQFLVKPLLLSGMTYREIGAELGIEKKTVLSAVSSLYRIYEVSGHGYKARRALCVKLGLEFPPTRVERMRQRVWELREGGMRRKEIAQELKIAVRMVDDHLHRYRRAQGVVKERKKTSTADMAMAAV